MIAGRKLVHGVGLNDAGYRVFDTHQENGRQVNTWTCPIYRMWVHMLQRCYSEKAHLTVRNSCYAKCYVDEAWHRFSIFRGWVLTQAWEGNQIDKDLLVIGNNEYGPNYCVFISQDLNKFMTDCARARGEWPVGVSRMQRSERFRSSCRNPFIDKYEHLGCFSSPELAHEAWRKKKHQHACTYAEMQADQRGADALRIRYSIYREKY